MRHLMISGEKEMKIILKLWNRIFEFNIEIFPDKQIKAIIINVDNEPFIAWFNEMDYYDVIVT